MVIDDLTSTEADCIAYMQEHSTSVIANGGTAYTIDYFWKAGDLQSFRLAHGWWPEYGKGIHAKPVLADLLRAIAGYGTAPNQKTFMELLHAKWLHTNAWLLEEGKDPIYPNETKEQRRSRKAREAMARMRARKSGNTEPQQREQLSKTKELHEAYLEACRARKAAHAEHTKLVDAAKAAWDAARNR